VPLIAYLIELADRKNSDLAARSLKIKSINLTCVKKRIIASQKS